MSGERGQRGRGGTPHSPSPVSPFPAAWGVSRCPLPASPPRRGVPRSPGRLGQGGRPAARPLAPLRSRERGFVPAPPASPQRGGGGGTPARPRAGGTGATRVMAEADWGHPALLGEGGGWQSRRPLNAGFGEQGSPGTGPGAGHPPGCWGEPGGAQYRGAGAAAAAALGRVVTPSRARGAWASPKGSLGCQIPSPRVGVGALSSQPGSSGWWVPPGYPVGLLGGRWQHQAWGRGARGGPGLRSGWWLMAGAWRGGCWSLCRGRDGETEAQGMLYSALVAGRCEGLCAGV